jgi:VWFA-related protein
MHRARVLRFIRIPLFVFFSLLLAGPAQGQAAPDSESGSAPTSFVKSVDEVSIDFAVRHKKKAVPDLKPEDVVVTDDGSVVKLADLRLVTGQSGANHLITLLFDPLDPSAATNARDIVKKILKLIPVNEFSFSVFNIEQRLRLFQEFTTDREKIQQAINAATSDSANRDQTAVLAEKRLISAVQSGIGQGQSRASANDRAVEKAVLASLTESRRIIQDQHTQAPLGGLLALVHAQTAIPGRKLVIYFTEGLQPDADERDALRSIAGAADRAEVSIYVINKTAVDTRLMEGLMQSQAMGALAAYNHFNRAPTGPAAQTPTVFSGGMLSQVSDQITRVEGEGLAGNKDPLAELAASTGGAYIFSGDNLKRPFRQAVADLTTYYEASYVPPALLYDGKFHHVRVKALRQGMKVQARAGYFAVPPTTGIRPFEAPLMKVLSEPQMPADVKFRAAVLQLGNLTTGNENTLVIEVPISGLESRSDPNTNLLSWHLSIVSEVKDKSGAVVEHFSEDIPGRGALDSKQEVLLGSATMQRHFALPPGEYSVETAVVDRHSGKMGGERGPFQIPNAASGPFLSDIALVRRIDPSPEELDPFEPLRYQHGKIVPGLSGQVVPGAKNTTFFFLVHPDSAASELAMLEMEVLRNGELMGQVPLQLPKDIGDAFPYIASLRTDSLPAGNYDVILSLTQGGKIMERESRFSISGPELASIAPAKTEPAGQSTAAASVVDSELGVAEIAPARRQPLAITSLPTDSVTRPSDDELNAIIEAARKHALNYSAKLPNFLCMEITDRSVDASGNGKWRRKDSFGELLRYVDNHETRKTLEVNGQTSAVKRDDLNGPISLGEFGHLLSLVFQPASKAEFHWKETDALANGTVQVFEYRVDRKNDSMSLTDSSRQIYSGYHGLAYIDSSTLGVRRITMEADDLPPDFSIHTASIAVDYDYVSIGAHDYLMPMRGTIRLQRGRHEADLNQIVFQDYRRYASQSKIIYTP